MIFLQKQIVETFLSSTIKNRHIAHPHVDSYFVIVFCLLHFLFQRNLVSVSLVYEYDLVTS